MHGRESEGVKERVDAAAAVTSTVWVVEELVLRMSLIN
jgi:hypothetical protein